MKYVLETKRLRLREFNLNDVEFIIELLNSPGWLQYIGDRNVKTPEQAKQYLLEGPMKSYVENGYGLSLVELKESQTAIGMCGIINRKELDNPDIGFALLPEFFGKGYALEIASATMDYSMEKWHLSILSAITLKENSKSIQLLEKLGFRFLKMHQMPGSAEELLMYIADRPDKNSNNV